MLLLNSGAVSRVPIAISSLPNQVENGLKFDMLKTDQRLVLYKSQFVTRSVAGDDNTLVGFDVPFPRDYSQLLEQATLATELALKDEKQLMEIEFPTAGLESVPGDGEGGNEMTGSMQLIREFCDCFVTPEKATQTRIFFPEAKEVEVARNSMFAGASFKLDYLTKPTFFEDFGFVEKVKMADRVKQEDKMFIVAYPYFNVNEMLVVEELYKEAVESTSRQMIIFNGELDRIRTGCILYLSSMVLPWTMESPEKLKGKICVSASATNNAIPQGSCVGYPPISLIFENPISSLKSVSSTSKSLHYFRLFWATNGVMILPYLNRIQKHCNCCKYKFTFHIETSSP